MPDTFVKIASVTVGSGGAANATFSAIPATYTDLLVKFSARNDTANVNVSVKLNFNGVTTNLSSLNLYGTGSTASSYTDTTGDVGVIDGDSATASTFGNGEVYIPNYAGSNYKSHSTDSVVENNATSAWAVLSAGLWSSTSAITSLTLTPNAGNWKQYSTFTLYGIKNS